MNIKIFVVIILAILTISCRDDSSMKRINKLLLKYQSDSIYRDMPNRLKEPTVEKELNEVREVMLGLPSLRNGSTDFQIRIWQDFMGTSGRVVILIHKNRAWSAEAYNYRYLHKADRFSSDSVAGQKIQLRSPKSGWGNFINSLLDYQILTLPDFSSIKSMYAAADEPWVKVEFSKKNLYRYYELLDPYSRQDESSYCKEMAKILDLVKEEFDLK